MKARRGKFSGAIGNEIYVNTKQRQVVWSRPRRKPRPPPTGSAPGQISAVLRRTLSDQQFAAWATAARKEGMLPYRFFCHLDEERSFTRILLFSSCSG